MKTQSGLRKLLALIPALAAMLAAVPAMAVVERTPQRVSISVDSATTTIVRYADDAGRLFTTTEALFCYALLPNNQCSPGTILGRLPPALDRGSSTTPVTAITDVMTVPYSVTRAALLRAQAGLFSDIYYVRRFTPGPSVGPAPVDLGAGPGVDVFVPVTLRLSGPAGNVPLSLSKVEVFATEGDDPKRITLVRLSNGNIETGRVHARITYTGSGRLEGWWEVRQPTDPALRPEDLLPQAALPPAQRAAQQHFLRVQRVSIPLFSNGQVVIDGPRYADLPQMLTGRSEILLRIEEFRDPNSRTTFGRAGNDVVYSGAVAAFQIPVLEYYVPAGLRAPGDRTALHPRLVRGTDDAGKQVFRVAWTPIDDTRLVMEFVAGPPGAERRVIAPAGDGAVQLPPEWNAFYRSGGMRATIRGPNNEAISPPEAVAVDAAALP